MAGVRALLRQLASAILARGPHETPLEQIGELLAGLVVLADDKQFSKARRTK
jgi:hypothetical protein